MVTRVMTTSDIVIEADVVTQRDSSFVKKAWFVYDPNPHGDPEQRTIRVVRIELPLDKLGQAEYDHLIEQAEEKRYDDLADEFSYTKERDLR